MNAAPDGENAQDGFGFSGLSAVQPLCSVSLKVFTTFFIFDLRLSRDSSNWSGERKEGGANELERAFMMIPVVHLCHLT